MFTFFFPDKKKMVLFKTLKSSILKAHLKKSIRLKRTLVSYASMTDNNSMIMRPFTVAVEGNIGSGKTTFLNYFKDQNVFILSEPVQKWRDCEGVNLLDLMYQDPERWAFSFQSFVQLTMLQQHLKETDRPVKLMERSIYSARYCFVENLLREKILPLPSGLVIHEWFKWIVSNRDLNLDLIVYLRTDPEIAYKRMIDRKRHEESKVPLEYLQKLHKLHEEWLVEKKLFSCPCPVLVLDANMKISELEKSYLKYQSLILNKMPAEKLAYS